MLLLRRGSSYQVVFLCYDEGILGFLTFPLNVKQNRRKKQASLLTQAALFRYNVCDG